MSSLKSITIALTLIVALSIPIATTAESIAQRTSGYILLQVEELGEAWYVYPSDGQRYYMPDGAAAYTLMRFLSLGITDTDLEKIPSVADTTEMNASSSICGSNSLANRLQGQILLQVQQNGEAWYVYPSKCRLIYLKDGAAAYEIMRFLGLGITNKDLEAIPAAPNSAIPNGSLTNNNQPPTQEPPELNDGHDSERQSLLGVINSERSSLGLLSLSQNRQLNLAAQAHANDMTSQNYFDFVSPQGMQLADWVNQAGYGAHSLAENIAQTNQGITSLVSVWKSQSPLSYNNVVNSGYKEIGIGVGTFQGLPTYTVIFGRSLEDFFTETTAPLEDLNSVRSEMLLRVNAERSVAGLAPLVMNNLLEQAAQAHTDDMLNRSYYGHETPEGVTPHERIVSTGYDAMLSAENIAKGQFSVQEVMDNWMDSPGHRANILGADFQEVGFGLSFGRNNNGYEVIWSQEFGTSF